MSEISIQRECTYVIERELGGQMAWKLQSKLYQVSLSALRDHCGREGHGEEQDEPPGYDRHNNHRPKFGLVRGVLRG